jgi:hypothetical protein
VTYRPATVDDLAEVAVELAVRIRDEDPAINAIWLTHKLPDPRDWFRLAFVLAAGVPVDEKWTDLTAWASQPAADLTAAPIKASLRTVAGERQTQFTCGTPAAAKRHWRRGEKPCKPCADAWREYGRQLKREKTEAA